MSLTKFFWGIACVLGISSGQIFFKLAAGNIALSRDILLVLYSLVSNVYLIAGLAIYVMTTFLWIALLRVAPLKQVYPIIALSYLFVPILSRLFLSEPLEAKCILGGCIIFIGVIVSVS
jgi:drug/metabolite transporter (DMT)-like permease